MESKIRVQLIEETFFDKPNGCKKTLKDLMSKFMRDHAPKVSIGMQGAYSSYLKHLIRLFGNINLASLSPKKITQYKVLRRQDGAPLLSIVS